MAKSSGGVRNYSNKPNTLAKRRQEFISLMNTGYYDKKRSYFDRSGGFVATHKEHNQISDKNADKSDRASVLLAKKGYKVYLDSEKAIIEFKSNRDGRIYTKSMDIKTISKIGKYTIKSAIEKVAKQKATIAILYQNTSSMDKSYVLSQIEEFKTKSPKKAKDIIDWVIVVGSNGNVHRHKMK